ncbi:hypothetical protein E2C01_012304 [Portunus trituberculatus]|uniref:Uncharacterized protein n=1 Tax=Portunus trituberculatus TaxID=210409 RepID=A0A5B7DDC7_PORTR|nr:hypothetical protein [Portunus trituberculatus]
MGKEGRPATPQHTSCSILNSQLSSNTYTLHRQDTRPAQRADLLPLPLSPPPSPWQLTPVLRPTPGQDYSTFKPSALSAPGGTSDQASLTCATIPHKMPSTGNHSTTSENGSNCQDRQEFHMTFAISQATCHNKVKNFFS